MSKIKVVLWDIDGTLLNFEEAEKNAIRACFAQFELGWCSDEMLADYSAINKIYWQRLERGELTKPEVLVGRFQEFFTKYGLNTACVPEFNAQYQLSLGDTICFYDQALETVLQLRGKVKQYAVTNGTAVAQKKKLARSRLEELLDGTFISDKIGFEKPRVEFFDHVWENIGHYEKDEVLIVGDSMTSDMQGGNNAGILCCWFNPRGEQPKPGIRIDYEISRIPQVLEICR